MSEEQELDKAKPSEPVHGTTPVRGGLEVSDWHVPPLHLTMIYVVAALSVLAMVGYFFASREKAEFFNTVTFTLIAFLCGKFSNSFGKPILVRQPPAPDEITSYNPEFYARETEFHDKERQTHV